MQWILGSKSVECRADVAFTGPFPQRRRRRSHRPEMPKEQVDQRVDEISSSAAAGRRYFSGAHEGQCHVSEDIYHATALRLHTGIRFPQADRPFAML